MINPMKLPILSIMGVTLILTSGCSVYTGIGKTEDGGYKIMVYNTYTEDESILECKSQPNGNLICK